VNTVANIVGFQTTLLHAALALHPVRGILQMAMPCTQLPIQHYQTLNETTGRNTWQLETLPTATYRHKGTS
jgi:hypothetical protein